MKTLENIRINGTSSPSGGWHWRCGRCGLIRYFVHQSEAEREARLHNMRCVRNINSRYQLDQTPVYRGHSNKQEAESRG